MGANIFVGATSKTSDELIINFEGGSSEPAIPPFIMSLVLASPRHDSGLTICLCRPKFAVAEGNKETSEENRK